MRKQVVVVYSGGLDSTTLLASLHLDSEHWEVVDALSIDYGQRHWKEIMAARDICKLLGVQSTTCDVESLGQLLPGSSQTDLSIAVPEGHYAADNMKTTVVPNRNAILLSIAIGRAIALGASTVAYAAHAGDHHQYPDCRPTFVDAMRQVAGYCHDTPIAIHAPFLDISKAAIVQIAKEIDIIPLLAKSWSCYRGLEHHCGRCGTCVERREAFALAGVEDPTHYDFNA